MKKYLYTRDVVCYASIGGKDITFLKNKEFSLPENDPLVIALVAQNFLSTVPVNTVVNNKPKK